MKLEKKRPQRNKNKINNLYNSIKSIIYHHTKIGNRIKLELISTRMSYKIDVAVLKNCFFFIKSYYFEPCKIININNNYCNNTFKK